MGSDEVPIIVLYIMGAGHSGSTVLDIMLGNHPEILSVGELANYTLNLAGSGDYCACGEPSKKCEFWSDVQREWTHLVGVDGVQGYLANQKAFERLRCWFRLKKEGQNEAQSPRFRLYAERTKALFEAIGVVSGKRIIVDSSKSPARALALSVIPGFDIRLIHLVRDGRGVVWSMIKKKARRKRMRTHRAYVLQWLASLDWLLANVCSEIVLSRTGTKGARIRYEDAVEQPEKILERTGGVLEIELDPVADLILSGKEMKIGHNMAGNRVRKAGSMRLRADYEWKKKLPRRDKRAFRLLAGFLARKYGYS